MIQFFLISPLAPLCLLIGIVFVTIYALHIAWAIKDRLFNSEASMDAYDLYIDNERKHADGITPEQAEALGRQYWEAEHVHACPMDLPFTVPSDIPGQAGHIIHGCEDCFFAYYRTEGASTMGDEVETLNSIDLRQYGRKRAANIIRLHPPQAA